MSQSNTVTFSLCHTTARLPLGWRKAAEAWLKACDNPSDVEHVLVTDHSKFKAEPIFPKTRFALNTGRPCAVDGWNTSAQHATGKFLITLADDWFPCPHWDTQIKRLVRDMSKPVVLDVNTGGDHDILTFSLLTRPYLDRLIADYSYSGFFYAGADGKEGYLGMMADAEFGELARMDGVIVKAKHLLFPHDHPFYSGKPLDAIHQWQHRDEARKCGERVFIRRMEEFAHRKFPKHVDQPGMPPLGEIFGIAWEPGTLAQLKHEPLKVAKQVKERKERKFMSGEIEAKTKHGWIRARIVIARPNGTVRIETANHVEYEVRQDDIRQIPQAPATAEEAKKAPPRGKSSAAQKEETAALSA